MCTARDSKECVYALMHHSVRLGNCGNHSQMHKYKSICVQPGCVHVQICSTVKVLSSIVMESQLCIDAAPTSSCSSSEGRPCSPGF